jgi:lon-related putative ATP-dependent protease
MARSLPAESLRWTCDPDRLGFEDTGTLDDVSEVIGQERAVRALRLAMELRRPGYNAYVLAPRGVHEREAVLALLEGRARTEPAPADWCYVNDFDDPRRPRAMKLPPGRGTELARELAAAVSEIGPALRTAFDGEEYRDQKQALEADLGQRHDAAIDALREDARRRGVLVQRTPVGFSFSPLVNGRPLTADDGLLLPDGERRRFELLVAEIQTDIHATLQKVPLWIKEAREELDRTNRETAARAIEPLLAPLHASYCDLPEVVEHLRRIQADVVEHVEALVDDAPEGIPAPFVALVQKRQEAAVDRYGVNPITDRSALDHAPVVYEDDPTFERLLGRIEQRAEMGALVTDFALIRGGTLHRANGGYLVVDARRLLAQPLAYERLKRALRAGEIRIEPAARALGVLQTAVVEPEPIPLDVKVVLLGDRTLYFMLCEADPEFEELFKIAADFDEELHRSPENVDLYARLCATVARRERLRPLSSSAVARLLEESARDADDAEKLSLRIESLSDLLRESDHHAARAGATLVTDAHVLAAVDSRDDRLDRVRERCLESIRRGLLLIDTDGSRVGQVNALAAVQVGALRFGRPHRITARIRLGRGEVIDIEREVDLGGALHSKGVLILGGFLGSRYAPEQPLSLAATLVFEQTYGAVDGDSASAAELCCLLSAIAGVPLRQDFAVTGSIDQRGQLQPVGGVNEKVEAFFDVCVARGLTGEQGVLIPHQNASQLMLRPRVVEAVRSRRFQIVPVTTVDEGIEVLTGMTPGERSGAAGLFPEGSFNARVESRLVELAAKRRAYALPREG